MKDIKDYLYLYLQSGISVYVFPDESIKNGWLDGYKAQYPYGVYNPALTFENYHQFLKDGYKPILRRLSDMTEDEMIGLLQSMVPEDMEDKPKDEDYDLEMFYNDDGLMVDGDIIIGANYTCICFDGQIGIRECGSVILWDEKDMQRPVNIPKAFHYLLKQGFDLFGLIDAGHAIDAKTTTP